MSSSSSCIGLSLATGATSRITYQGELMPFPAQAPRVEQMLRDEWRLPQLAGFLTISWADRIRSSEHQGSCLIDLHFYH